MDLPEYEPAFLLAVKRFWMVRDQQVATQAGRGVVDAGTRGAVTGGQHLNEVRALIHQVLVDAGMGMLG